jgi:hypothetical protein
LFNSLKVPQSLEQLLVKFACVYHHIGYRRKNHLKKG